MGAENSKPLTIGSKSKNYIIDDENIDYKDKKYARKAKEELYELFMENKIVHVSVYKELEKNNQKLNKEINENKKTIEELKDIIEKFKNKIEQLKTIVINNNNQTKLTHQV